MEDGGFDSNDYATRSLNKRLWPFVLRVQNRGRSHDSCLKKGSPRGTSSVQVCFSLFRAWSIPHLDGTAQQWWLGPVTSSRPEMDQKPCLKTCKTSCNQFPRSQIGTKRLVGVRSKMNRDLGSIRRQRWKRTSSLSTFAAKNYSDFPKVYSSKDHSMT